MLISYIRDENKHPIGTIVAIPIPRHLDESFSRKYSIGYSICNDCDRFNKEMGKKIAMGRAFWDSKGPIPNRIVNNTKMDKLVKDELERMNERASKYFK